MVTVPIGVIAYVPITLTNSQSTAVSSGTQLKFTVDWNTYSSYLDNPVDNYAFFDVNGNLLYSWLESGTANTSAAAVVWVKSNAIITASGGTWTFYLGFYALGSNQLSSSGYTGEYPNATVTYGQYDNGTLVFSFYDNFAGSSLDANWTATQAVSGSASYSVNNGLTITAGTIRSVSTKFTAQNVALEAYISETGSHTSFGVLEEANATYIAGGNGNSNAFVMVYIDGTSLVGVSYAANGLAPSYNVMNQLSYATFSSATFAVVTVAVDGTYCYTFFNYTQKQKQSGTFNTNQYILLGDQHGTGATTNTQIYQWVRTRVLPPTGAFPSSSFGSVILTSEYFVDVDLKKLKTTIPYEVDTDFKKLGQSKTYSADILFFGTLHQPYNIDSLIRNTIITTTSMNKIDVLLNHPYRYNIDTDLKKLKISVTDSIDALCKKLKITRTTLIDTIIANAKQYSIDTDLHTTVPIRYAIDVDFKKYEVPVQYIVDVRFIKTYTSTYAIDMMLAATNFSATYLADTLFKKLDNTTTIGVDTTLLSIIPPIPPIYAQQTLLFTNPNGQLWVFPTAWKEDQDCTPAIRQVPLAESEYLDKDSYVLKAREIDVTFRVSDSEKELLESIYSFASTEGANDFTDIYLFFNNQDTDSGVHPKPAPSVPKYTWHYVAWLNNKEYKYEYAYQDGRYVRWWTVSLTINVESFSGSSAIEPEGTPFSMAVVLDGHQLVHITEFERSDKHPPMLPEWVNQPAEVDSYIWNECVLDITYSDKMSNDEKYLMDLSLQNHVLVNLTDYIHNVQGLVWISSISAKYNPSNWAKPWDVDISIQGNNNQITFDAEATITVDSYGVSSLGVRNGYDHKGTLYIDEQVASLGLPSTPTLSLGVHVFYFFLPSIASGFTAWSVSGNAVIVGEDTYDVQTWDRESRVSVLIYGACTIIAQYTMPATEQCVTIALDSGLSDASITNVGLIAIGNVWQGSGSNSLTNGGFETGSINPWGQIGGDPTEQVVNGGFEDGNFTGWTNTGNFISSNPATVHSGSYSLGIYEQLTTQTFGAPIPVSSITSFSFWAQGNSFVNGSFLVVTYTDATYTNFPINFTNGGAATYYQFFPLSSLTAGKSIASIAFHGGLEGVIYIDDVALISTEGWVLNGPQAHSGNYCIKRSSVATAGIEQSSLSINVDDVIEAYFWAWTDQIALGFELIVNMGGAGTIDYTFYAPNPETWTQFDFLHLLAPYLGEGAVINSVTINALGSGCIIANIYLDDIVISIGGLPADFNGELFLGQPYSLQWMTDTSNPTAVFDHWEVVCGDITIANPALVSTTFTMNSGTLAWIRAIYVDTDPILYFTSLNEQYGTYNNGGIYINEQITSLPLTAHYSDVHGVSGLLQFAPPNVCQDTFVTWWTDNPSQITFGNPTDYFTTFTATGSGIIRAVFRGPNS